MSLRPTFACNLNCRMCSFANSSSLSGDVPITGERDFLPVDVAKRLVDEIGSHPLILSVTGGEPFLWPGLHEFLAHTRSQNIVTSVTTNGSLLPSRVDELMAAPPDVLIVSVLGDRETHDAIVGRAGMYDRIVEGLRAVHAAKRRKRFLRPLLVINTPILPENALVCYRVLELGRSIPVLAHHFQHLWFVTEDMRTRLERVGTEVKMSYTECIAVDTPSIDPEVIWQGIERIRAHAKGTSTMFYPELTHDEVRTYYSDPCRLLKHDHAICGWIFTHVLPNGDVSPCLGLVAGNITQQPFAEIWNGEEFRRFRRLLRERRVLPICSRCCVFFRDI